MKPKNISSLRGYSFDDEPYYNHAAIVFKLYDVTIEKLKFCHSYNDKYKTIFPSPIKDRVEVCIAELMRRGMDITATYAAWFEIGCSLAAEFGEGGRSYFHQVSQFHPKYSNAKTDKQFNSCLKGNYKYSIATFFMYFRSVNV